MSEAMEAVLKAAAQQTSEEEVEGTDDKADSKETPKQEAQEQEEETEEEETPTKDDPVRTRKALQLLEALEDENIGPAVIERMARNAGLLKAETKTETAKAEAKFARAIQQALGEEYSFLGDKLAPAIQQIAESLREEFQSSVQEVESQRQAIEVQNTALKFFEDNKVTDAEIAIMDKISTVIPVNPKAPIGEYLGYVLTLARQEQDKIQAKVKTAKKIQSNLEDKSTNKGVEGSEIRTVKRPSTLTARQAVEAALRGETFED